MKHILRKLILLFVAVLPLFSAGAQEVIAASNRPESHRLFIPTLEVLIDSALAKNGMLNYRKSEIEVKTANLTAKKRNWTRNFGVQADSRYGNFNNFASNVSGSTTITLATNSTQLNYGVGFYLKIPVFDVFNRKSDIKQAKAELKQAESLIVFQEDEIKETVIRYYEDLILKQNLLEIQAANLSDARVNMEMAKVEFTNGQIPLYEYTRISDITSGVATEYEKRKSELFVAKRLLENLTGVQIK